MRKIFPFVLLNIVVSAVTVLAVLMIWEATHHVAVPGGLSPLTTPAGQYPIGVTQPPTDVATIVIQAVIAAGDVNNERVEFASVSQAPINLLGWELQAGEANRFVFPSVTIFPDGDITIFSRAGVNTSAELFWGRAEAAFSRGELVRLVDAAGNTRSEYRVP